MRQENYLGSTVTVKVRYADFETHTHAKTLEQPTDDADAICRAAFECLPRFGMEKAVRLIGVRVGDLHKAAEPATTREAPS
jgi:DNA polymerase-4